MRKRILCAMFALLMVVTLLPVVAGADATPTIKFVQQETAAGASKVKVDVVLENNPGFVSATIPVKWDPSIMTLTDSIQATNVVDTGWCGMSMTEYATNGTQGTYYLAWDNDTRTEAGGGNFTGDGKLHTLEFTLVDNTKDTATQITSELSADIANMMNYDMQDLRNSGLTAVAGMVNVTAADAGGDTPVDPTPTPSGFYVEAGSVKGKAGDTVEVPITLYNNPGLASMKIVVEFSENLKFVGIVDKGLLGSAQHPEEIIGNKFNLYWEDGTATENYTSNGVVATIQLKIADDAEEKDVYAINLSTVNWGIVDVDAKNVNCEFVNGKVEVIKYIIGDVDGDGEPATPRDAMYLARYIAGWIGYDELVDVNATDIDGDGEPATPRDAMLFARHIAGWIGYETLPVILGN